MSLIISDKAGGIATAIVDLPRSIQPADYSLTSSVATLYRAAARLSRQKVAPYIFSTAQ